jgi:hypothetical protein
MSKIENLINPHMKNMVHMKQKYPPQVECASLPTNSAATHWKYGPHRYKLGPTMRILGPAMVIQPPNNKNSAQQCNSTPINNKLGLLIKKLGPKRKYGLPCKKTQPHYNIQPAQGEWRPH